MERALTNPAAQVWLDAAADLGIRVIHPVTFTTRGGITATSAGVLLPDFGGYSGTLLLNRFDPDELYDLADDTDFYRSGLNPSSYEPYRRALCIETLEDWGWFGRVDQVPPWFNGWIQQHGGGQRRGLESR